MALLLQAPSVYGTQCLVLVYIHMALLLQAPSVYGTQCLVLVYIHMALLLQVPSVYGTQCLVLVYTHGTATTGTQCLWHPVFSISIYTWHCYYRHPVFMAPSV